MAAREPARSLLPAGIEPRFLSREQAAEYLGVSVGTFDYEVANGVWPRPMRRGTKAARVTWDRIALDAAADAASGLARTAAGARRSSVNTWDGV